MTDFVPILLFGGGMCCCVCPLFLGVMVMWCGEGGKPSRHNYAAPEVFEDAEKDFSYSPAEYFPRTFTMDPTPLSSATAAAASVGGELSHRPSLPRRLSEEGIPIPLSTIPSYWDMELETHRSPKTPRVVQSAKNFMHLLGGRKECAEKWQVPSPGRNHPLSSTPSLSSPAKPSIFSRTAGKAEDTEAGPAERSGLAGLTRLAMDLREGRGGKWFWKGMERREEGEGRAVEMETIN